VFETIFKALQRFHFMVFLKVAPLGLTILAGIVSMTLMRRWGILHPEYGEVVGATLGSAIGGYIGQLLSMTIAMLLYREFGFSLKVTMLAHFTWDTVKRALRYGLQYTPGAMAPLLSLFAQPIILSIWLNNYLELNSLIIFILIMATFMVIMGSVLYENLLPSISEAFSHGRLALTRHYIDQGLKWSLLFTGVIASFYLVVAEKLVIAIFPPQWERIAEYVGLGFVFGVFEFLGRLPGEIFLGAGKPRLFTYTTLGEHIIRVILMVLLVPEHGVRGVLYAYIVSSIIKSIVAWTILAVYVIRPRISWWQTIFVPLIISFLMYGVATVVTAALWTDTAGPADAAVLVAALVLIMTPIFYFMTGLLGGFDDNSLEEFQDALSLTRFTQFMGHLFYRPTEWGARLSPLHGRFPLVNWEEAEEEAETLTAEKVAL